MSEEIARRMESQVPGSILEGFLDPQAVLVPMPRSGLQQRGQMWPALRIAEALMAHGFGSRVAPLVVRTQSVRRSSASLGPSRLWPDQHYDSMEVQPMIGEVPSLLLLVDDVVTRGATLLGAAGRLADAFPGADLRGFAVVRTIKPGEALKRIIDPRVGDIAWRPGWITREP